MNTTREAHPHSTESTFDEPSCRLSIDGVAVTALVASWSGVERLSGLFSYSVEARIPVDDATPLDAWVGRDAALVVTRASPPGAPASGVERVVHGVVRSVARAGYADEGRVVRVAVELAPRVARLADVVGYRVFSTVMAREVVDALLRHRGIDYEWRVRPEPPIREYRVQVGETDLELLLRVLADDGLHFFFEHRAASSTLVVTNRWSGFATAIDDVALDAGDGAGSIAGTTTSLGLTAGAVILAGEAAGTARGRLVVTEVDVRFATRAATGASEPATSARFSAIAADPFVRPPSPARPRTRVQIARIVGPCAGEPFVDDFGRVQVAFDWESGAVADDARRTCWMWPANAGDDAAASPFVAGSDAIVDFTDGDIDRPVLTMAIRSAAGTDRPPSDAAPRSSSLPSRAIDWTV